MRRIIYFSVALILLPVFLLRQPPAVSQLLVKKENKLDTNTINLDSIRNQNVQLIDSINENLSFRVKNKAINLYKKVINESKKYK